MTKYIIWFFYYSLSNNPHNIRTYIEKDNDSISFYLYDVGYWKWKIDHTAKEIISEESPYFKHSKNISAVYIISSNNDRGIIHIHKDIAFITIFMDGNVYSILLSTKRPPK